MPRPSLAPDAPPATAKDDTASLGPWIATSFGAYAAPASIAIRGADHTVDVVFHFHGARLADKEWRAAGLDAVVVDAELGGTSTAFADAMAAPGRFAKMKAEVLEALRARTHQRDLAFGKIGLVSFSAGYAAVLRILADPEELERIDAVVLLDSLHASYEPSTTPAPERVGPFRRPIDAEGMGPFVAFGRRAAAGQKLLLVTHSDVIPPDYASTTETAFTLTVVIDARLEPRDGRDSNGLWASDASDMRDYHMRGYWGATGEAHLAQLHLVGDLVRQYLVPRWSR